MVNRGSATPPTPPLEKFRTALGRYVRARSEDVLGGGAAHRATRVWIDRMIADLHQRPDPRAAKAVHAISPATWVEAVARAGLTAADLRRRYIVDAPLARALLLGVGVSGLIVIYRGWLGDGAGVGASLGAAFTLAGLALPPAYRCWQIRTRTLHAPRQFLRHPAGWWPSSLPDDDAP